MPSLSILPVRSQVDYALVGGGLQSGLIALALMWRRPDATFAVFERESRLGGNHVWSFHAGDLSPAMAALVEPLVERRWAGYRVAFPGLLRDIASAYASTSSQRLHTTLTARCAAHAGASVLTGVEVTSVEPQRVVLADGREWTARVVIDARGPQASTLSKPADSLQAKRGHVGCAYQKFVGIEFALDVPVEDSLPVIMDAEVPQTDGYRFFYTLPFEPRRVLVEDTYFSDSPQLDISGIREQIMAYVRKRGWQPRSVLREEHGVLPLPWRLPRPAPATSPFRAGFGGGWFHPTTGYSFPMAARLADVISSHEIDALPKAWATLSTEHRRQTRFCGLLNRLLYRHFAPATRWRVLARFYRLPEPTIARFYALNLTVMDRARILCGRPPQGMSLRPVPGV